METLGENSYAGTDWSTLSVQDIWQLLSNQTVEPFWTVTDGWRKSHELTGDHMATVQRYKDNLIQAWPPDTNPAAAAYVRRLDDLLAKLQNTYEAAVANEKVLATVTAALSEARSRIEPLANEYGSNATALQNYEATKSDYKMSSPKAVPPPPSPVAAGRQEAINAEARQVMYRISTEISTAKTQVVQPEQFIPNQDSHDGVENVDSNNDAPIVPPIIPIQTHNSSGAGNSATPPVNGGHTPSQITPPSLTEIPGARQPGIILGGAPGQTGVLPPSVTPGGMPNPGGSSPIQMPNVITPASPLLPGPGGGSPAAPFGPQRTPAGLGRGAVAEPPPRGISAGRAMAPGGVIGGQPGAGVMQPANGGRQTQRVNPSGGILNPSNQQSPRGSNRGTGSPSHLTGTPQGRRDRRDRDEETGTHWDPDNPWETAEGVAPVLRPAKERPIDPGPAIGLDR